MDEEQQERSEHLLLPEKVRRKLETLVLSANRVRAGAMQGA